MTLPSARAIRIAAALGLLLAAALLAACSQQTPANPAEENSASAPPPPPTITLIKPGPEETVKAGDVTVAVKTTGLTFSMPSNTNVAGEGHVHFTLDDRPFVMSTEPEAAIEDVEAGPHTLVAELVQNDTSSFDPPVKQTIEFTTK